MTVEEARKLRIGDLTSEGRVKDNSHVTEEVKYTWDGKPYIYLSVAVSVWPSTRL